MLDVPVVQPVLLLCILVSSCHGFTYCVSPNTSATYNGVACRNLSIYVRNPASYFQSFTSFVFLPGNHVFDLGEFLQIDNVTNVTFVGGQIQTSSPHVWSKSPLRVEESSSKLTCSKPSGFSFTNSFNITLINLVLINCSVHAVDDILGDIFASIYLSNIEGFYMEGVSIQNSSGIIGITIIHQISIMSSFFLHIWPEALFLFNSDVPIYNTTFMYCSTAINSSEGNIEIMGSTLIANTYGVAISDEYVIIEDCFFFDNTYAILSTQSSKITVNGCVFDNNEYAMGLLLLSKSYVSSSVFSRNVNAGYFQNSDIHYANSSFVGSNFSCITALFSKLYFTGDVHFANNFSPDFGGAFFMHGSVIHLTAPVTMVFENNTAALSGGVLYSDNTFSALSYQPCFFQFNDTAGTLDDPNIHIFFNNNDAHESGRILYGSLYECTLDRSLIPHYDFTSPLLILAAVSTITESDSNITDLAADPKRVCRCTSESSYQCPSPQSTPVSITVYPGQEVTLSIVSLDEYNGATPAIVFALSGSKIMTVFRTINRCSDYTISATVNQNITLLTQEAFVGYQNPFPLSVEMLPCPLGFTLDPGTQACVCSSVLQQNGAVCSIINQTIQKPANSWVGIVANNTVAIGTFCLVENCNQGSTSVNLSSKISVDMQCINNHGGILCGGCQEGLSVILGSASCRKCTNNYYLFLLVIFALMGVSLVGLLFLLNLTVSIGTVNGIIFYANIINSNSDAIFPNGGTNGFTRFLSVFISWLNLDFGIETCFYDRMDSYSKAWLQFVFPIYIMFLMVVIIIAGRFSNTISRWCKHNVVPAMATLVLLLYTKILRNVAAIFSYTDVSVDKANLSFYSSRWLHDANVEYLEGKHAPLFVSGVAMTILYIFPITAVLLFTPCLQMKSHWKPLMWVNKLKPFLDSYQAPFKDRYRFWTGALLLVRFFLYGFVTVSTSTVANLLAVVMAVLFPLVCILGLGVYKKWSLTILEGFLYSNAVVLAILVYLQSKDVNLTAVVSLGVGSALCCFIGIIVYHIIVFTKLTTFLKRAKLGPKHQDSPREGSPITISANKDDLYEELSDSISGYRKELIN